MSTENNNRLNTPEEQSEFLSISDLLYMCLSKWYWFVASLALTLVLAVLYVKTTPPTWQRSASVLVKDESKGGLSASDMPFADMGFLQTKSNVNNEMLSMKSIDVMNEVVRRLGLNVSYHADGFFYDPVLYGRNLPLTMSFLDLDNNEQAGLTLHLTENGISLNEFTLGKDEFDDTVTGSIGDTLTTPVGRILVKANSYYTPSSGKDGSSAMPSVIYVSRSSMTNAVNRYQKAMTFSIDDEKASVITMSIEDASTQRAEDILSTVIAVYNEKWVMDKNLMAVSTSNFIADRLAVIENELGVVDENISDFKSRNLMPDVQAMSSMYMEKSSKTDAGILELGTKISLAKYIKSYMSAAVDEFRLFPSNLTSEDAAFSAQVSEYNTMVLERNNLVANSSESNPLVGDLDRTLTLLRSAILASVDEQIMTLNIQLEELQKTEEKTNERIAESPSQAKYLLTVERQQKVKEALYLFLLQKREENELSQAFTAYNTRIINHPHGSVNPVSPKSMNILLIAFVLGLMIPVGLIFVIEMLNTRVRDRKDIEGLSIPFIGEIPLSYRKKKHFFRPWKRQKEVRSIVVKEGSRNVINEAFRVVRANFEFILGKDGANKVVMLTSMNAGSGKTFITANLATSIAIKGKKAVVLDLDLRKAALSELGGSPKPGVSDWLNGNVKSWNEIVVKDALHKGLDLIPVGTLPPNPAELLYADRLGKMISALREAYDYIFIDCPPVEIVADTSIIAEHADMTVFVVRADMFEKAAIPVVESYYENHKFRSMCLILNGTELLHSGYGYHRYGYGSYGYGYGYGGYATEK